MITGGKIGQIIGRKRDVRDRLRDLRRGSFVTAISPNLAVLIVGWSFLEGVGAALILPAIVALVASNFPPAERPRAYGLVASAGAIAVGGLSADRGPDSPPTSPGGGSSPARCSSCWRSSLWPVGSPTCRPSGVPNLDLVGTALSAVGLGLVVFGVLRAGAWGFVQSQTGRSGMARPFARDLVDAGRGGRPVAVPRMGEPAHRGVGTEALVNPAILRNGSVADAA